MKRTLSLVLCLVLCLSLVSSAMAQETNSEYIPKLETPVTLTTHTLVQATRPYPEGQSAESNGYIDWFSNHMNINWKIDWTTSDATSQSQKLDLAFASDSLPDVISATIEQLGKYVAADKIMPLDDLIEQYGSPLLKWAMNEGDLTNGATFMPYTFGGKLYAFPRMSDMTANWMVSFIRADILKELNMEIPTTLDELEAVLAAYKAAYPNNYPIAMDNNLNNGSGGLEILNSAFNAYTNMWQIADDGSLEYTSIQPEMRSVLERAAEWYKKGYINPEFVIIDGNKVSETVSAGNFLVYHGYWWNIGGCLANLSKNVATSEIEIMPHITNGEGTGKIMRSPWFQSSYSITAGCEHPEAVIYAANAYIESLYRNEPMVRTAMEELDYDMLWPVTEVREPINKDLVAEKYANVTDPNYYYEYDYPEDLTGPFFLNNFYMDENSIPGIVAKSSAVGTEEYASMTEYVETGDETVLTTNAAKKYNSWNNTDPSMPKTFSKIFRYYENKEMEVNAYAGATTATQIEKQTYLDKLQLETFTRIVMGTEPIEAFDEYVAEWKANGGDQITQEVNDWYATTK